MTLEVHRYAHFWPLMGGDEFDDLVADIRENGLIEPIVLVDGDILDGRNRYRACLAAGVAPRFIEYDGDREHMLAWVVSKNMRRRHLNPSQMALAAAEIAGERRAIGQADETALADAAAEIGVSERHAQYAQTVIRRGVAPLVDLVREGQISIFAADKVAMLPPAEQNALVAAGPEKIREWLHEIGGSTGRFAGLSPASKSQVPKKAPQASMPAFFTSWGTSYGECGRQEFEQEDARQVRLVRFRALLKDRLPPLGDVGRCISDAELLELWERAGE